LLGGGTVGAGGAAKLAPAQFDGGVPCASIALLTASPAFSIMRSGRTAVNASSVMTSNLTEKLERNDLSAGASGGRFQTPLYQTGSYDSTNRARLFGTENSPWG
jgi:hypothetical protein